MVFAHFGMRHSYSTAPKCDDFGKEIFTLWPVDLTYGVFTSPASAVTQSRASGPPPVSSARCLPLLLSYQRGLITQL
jgi:hypothetical protein